MILIGFPLTKHSEVSNPVGRVDEDHIEYLRILEVLCFSFL
jgi:hypothetical protein